MPECLSPYQLKERVGKTECVPCGKCPNCLKRRVSGWSFRLMQQYKVSTSGHFITLTYDTKHVPITDNGFMGLSKKDLQLFFKRLRKAHPPGHASIKYYAAGEYGSQTNRPHYHIIMFNALVELIQPAWNKGEVHYGTLTEASVGYTLKYIHKKAFKHKHANDDRQPEFALMSKGLGSNYLTPAVRTWHLSNMEERMYLPLMDGKKAAMPRYYKLKLYTDDERSIIADAAFAMAEQKFKKLVQKHGAELNNYLEQKRLGTIKRAEYKNSLMDKL